MNLENLKFYQKLYGLSSSGKIKQWPVSVVSYDNYSEIIVDYEEGSSQGIGGICLDTFDDVKKKRVGSAYGCEMIRRLLLTLKVDDFSQMKGKMIWVYGEGEFLSFKPKGLSLLSVDDPKAQTLIFRDVAAEFGI